MIDALPPARIQVGIFSSDRCREIEAALIASGYLDLKPSKLELQYPYGGVWYVKTTSERAVIAVTARPTDDLQWILKIQPTTPLRPHVVYRKPPSEAQMKQFEQMCYQLALVLHEALQPLRPELPWATATDQGTRTFSPSPAPPDV
jgi:hypothetical protein